MQRRGRGYQTPGMDKKITLYNSYSTCMYSASFRTELITTIICIMTFDLWSALFRHCIMGSSLTRALLYPSTSACLTRNPPSKTWSPSTLSFTTPSCGSSEYQDCSCVHEDVRTVLWQTHDIRADVLYVHRENDLEECGVELYFAQDMEILGKVTTHQLKNDGENELVTQDNKEEYIRYSCPMFRW